MHNVYLFLLILIHFKNICLKLDSGTRVLFFSGSHCNEFLQENEVMSSKYCVVQMKKEQKRIDKTKNVYNSAQLTKIGQ